MPPSPEQAAHSLSGVFGTGFPTRSTSPKPTPSRAAPSPPVCEQQNPSVSRNVLFLPRISWHTHTHTHTSVTHAACPCPPRHAQTPGFGEVLQVTARARHTGITLQATWSRLTRPQMLPQIKHSSKRLSCHPHGAGMVWGRCFNRHRALPRGAMTKPNWTGRRDSEGARCCRITHRPQKDTVRWADCSSGASDTCFV